MRRCANPRCRLLWLDPVPTIADLPETYRLGERERVACSPDRGGKRLFEQAAIALLWRLNRVFLLLTPRGRERERLTTMYLRDRPPGKVLIAGCHNGTLAVRLRALGWAVTGQDLDARAVDYVQGTLGIPARLGLLEEVRFSAASFDVVVLLNLEHGPDPIALLKECHRLLKPGGTLAVFTPNTESHGYQLLGRDWEGLQVPRHWHIFTRHHVRALAANAGFRQIRAWVTRGFGIEMDMIGFHIKWNGQKRMSGNYPAGHLALALLHQVMVEVLALRRENVGDVCILQASK